MGKDPGQYRKAHLFDDLAGALLMEVAHWIENCRQEDDPLDTLVRLAQSVASSDSVIPGLSLLANLAAAAGNE